MTSDGAGYGGLLVTSLLVLAVVCAVAFVALRLFGRMLMTGRNRGTHMLDVVARVALEPRRSLYVVAVANKTLLVGTSEMGLSVLTELDGAAVKAHHTATPSFGALVRAALSRRRAVALSDGDRSPPPRDERPVALSDGDRSPPPRDERPVALSDGDRPPPSRDEGAVTVGDLRRRTYPSRGGDSAYTEPRIELATKVP